MNKKNSLLPVLLLLVIPVSGQEFLGLKMGNYAGSNGMLLNPSSLLNGNLAWDVNLAAAGVFAQNNYVYAPDATVWSLLRSETETAFFETNKVNAHSAAMLQGPSAFIRTGNMAFGLFTTARSAGFVHTETFSDGVQVLENIQEGVPVQMEAFNASLLNWAEFGLTGALSVGPQLQVGANVKLLAGYDAATLHNRNEFTFTRFDRETEATNLLFDYSYSSNLGSDRGLNAQNYQINGWGLGTDIGFTWIEPARGAKKQTAAWAWKAGASLIDVGYIRFKENAGTYRLAANEVFAVGNTIIDSMDDLDELTLQGGLALYDDVDAAQVDNKFPVFTPAAISFQGSVNLGKGWFIHTMATQSLAFLHEQMVARPNLIAVVPQYDTRLVSVSLPLSLYDYEEAHLGASVRFMYFTIGTDNLASWIVPGSLDGADVYAGIRIFPYQLAEAGSKVGSKWQRNKAKQLHCPSVF